MDARPPEPRQRWRLVVARDEAARDMLHRDVVAAWESGLVGSGLPVSLSETATPRPRIAFAAQAPVGMLAERELIDVVLTELRRIHDVRATVEAAAPAGYRLVDLYDVWLSSPTLASLVDGRGVPGDGRAGRRGDRCRAPSPPPLMSARASRRCSPRTGSMSSGPRVMARSRSISAPTSTTCASSARGRPRSSSG